MTTRRTRRCSFCGETARYITPQGGARFCYWHTLLLYVGYDLEWHD